jgi:hypothetical protein
MPIAGFPIRSRRSQSRSSLLPTRALPSGQKISRVFVDADDPPGEPNLDRFLQDALVAQGVVGQDRRVFRQAVQFAQVHSPDVERHVSSEKHVLTFTTKPDASLTRLRASRFAPVRLSAFAEKFIIEARQKSGCGAGGITPMTEQAWLESANPNLMLDFLRGKVSDRKLRLFACACIRSYWVWARLQYESSRLAVEMAERFVDGEATSDDLDAAWVAARVPTMSAGFVDLSYACAADGAATWTANRSCDWNVAIKVLEYIRWWHDAPLDGSTPDRILRDIFGNPFRPVSLDPSWRTSTVVKLAEAIYQDRTFDRLPILGDALEDAGCTNADILTHCRQPGEHVRGCWCLDLVLDKE